MNVDLILKNKIYIENIINTDKNINLGICIGDNLIEKINETLISGCEMINLEQLAELNKKLVLGQFSRGINSYCFTSPLFFAIENPLYEINYLIFTVENNSVKIKINCTPNMKYLHHELVNPLGTIYNAAMLINLELEHTHIKRNIEPYIRIIHNQVDNCNHISRTFLYNENSYQNINLFMYLKSYLYDYYNSYNFSIDFDRDKLKEYARKELMVRVPRNIIYFKIILDNIFKNAIYHNKKDGPVKLDFQVKDDKNCVLEITNLVNMSSYGSNMNNLNTAININTSTNSGSSSGKLLNISQSHYVGMELISKLCAKLEFKWNLVQNNDKIIFTLDIPLVDDSFNASDKFKIGGIMV